ncbi:SDR family NAD(P)-dependent oxidoreductase [Brevibacillus dissolubilis]|uniref:SDR family NAD(P)-dependent oxidoreductase n=1 Tax=Brevibacillus dissolubilis TaxID=1844116 RepID=UPI0011165DF3|nr:SDR family NAD(P)-dependent oxidoreductase [Brevibacillus dissolubilis]
MIIDTRTRIDKVLEMIKDRTISSEEGFRLIKELQQGAVADGTATAVSSTVYYQPLWEERESAAQADLSSRILLLDTDENQWNRLTERGIAAVLVKPGEAFAAVGERSYVINPLQQESYDELLDALERKDLLPEGIIHQWSTEAFYTEEASLCVQLDSGIYSLFHLSKALLRKKPKHPVKLLYAYPTQEVAEPQYAGVSGFAKTIRQEQSAWYWKTVEINGSGDASLDLLLNELQAADDEVCIRYQDGKRYVKQFRVMKPNGGQSIQLRENGTYLITGGLGGLGLIFANDLAGRGKGRLVLTGRSELTPETTAIIQQLQEKGAEVLYLQADVSNREEVEQLVSEATARYGEIHGVIHAAGVLRDSYLVNKTKEQMQDVLASKVYGTLWLDEATKEQNLDFFVMFSSIMSVLGNLGQADYAYANGFMDSYAEYRESLREGGVRKGKTVSINWPLWKEGGMQVDESTLALMEKTLGMAPMPTESGIQAFGDALALQVNQLVVMEEVAGSKKRVFAQKVERTEEVGQRAAVAPQEVNPSAGNPSPSPSPSQEPASVNESEVYEKTCEAIIEIVTAILYVDREEVDLQADKSDYGFDSISTTDFINRVNDTFDLELTPPIFFEHSTIGSFVSYLWEKHKESFINRYGGSLESAEKTANTEATAQTQVVSQSVQEDQNVQHVPYAQEIPQIQETPQVQTIERVQPADHQQTTGAYTAQRKDEPIAIVGISGVFPQSDTLDEFWQNLEAGKDLITEIPQDRWDWQEYYGDPANDTNKTNIKWGGFMKAVDKFDPLFFGISPREAQIMDPRQRIFLQTVWKTIEDAGYKPSDLSGSKTGLFVGVVSSDYYDLLCQSGIDVQAQTATGVFHSILANRISYLLNLTGPSEPIDTACSGSLVAIHRAVEAIRNGDCEMAIAGGVSVIASPNLYIAFNKAGMLSEDGRCKTFDKNANGYVRGEGSGAILLKPLSKAQADGDHIYGVIKGTAINHGGHANSLTAPNPNAQAELIVNAWRKSGIDPATVTYIEAHGTGTPLGDPIEINALKKAFDELYQEWGHSPTSQAHIGLGSVKTYIGHLEAAAGIAGIIKVLLSMKHGKLLRNLHFGERNPYIKLEGSPFYIMSETKAWERPADGAPRRAGVSSFGFGGVNAHVIIEEDMTQVHQVAAQDQPQVLVLSAKSEDRLKEYAKRMVDYLETTKESLAEIAYTLQTGREAMEERLSLVASSVSEFREKLTRYLQGKSRDGEIYLGTSKATKAALRSQPEGVEGKTLHQLAESWASGADIDWKRKFYNSEKLPSRVSLPTYPFAEERYWIPQSQPQQGTAPTISLRTASSWAASAKHTECESHPLLHRNTSDFSGIRYSSTFDGQEFFLADHLVKGQKVLPGVAYLEMARAAVAKATGSGDIGIKLSNVVWASPIRVEDQPVDVHIRLTQGENGLIHYEIGRETETGESSVYSQGSAVTSPVEDTKTLDLPALQAQCRRSVLSSAQCYEMYRAMGLTYGPGHQGIQEVYIGADQVVAKLSLPDAIFPTQHQYVLHPSLMDSALQAAIGLTEGSHAGAGSGVSVRKPALPFALQELHVIRPCTTSMWALIRYSEGSKAEDKVQKLDIDLCDEHGAVCVQMRGYTSRILENGAGADRSDSSANGILMLEPNWKVQEVGMNDPIPAYAQHLVILCEPEDHVHTAIQHHMHHARIIRLQSGHGNKAERFNSMAVHLFEEIQSIIQSRPKEQVLIQVVCWNQGGHRLFTGLSALLKTARLENPKLITQLIEAEPREGAQQLIGMLRENSRSPQDAQVRYQQGQRFVAGQSVLQGTQSPKARLPLPWRDYGVYLLTGGAGGLGLIFAKEIVQNVKQPTLILTGRSSLTPDKQSKLRELEAWGAKIDYRPTDVANRTDVDNLIQSIVAEYGGLNGIIHSAGVIHDNYILRKTSEEFQQVLAPKTAGTVNLDEATKKLNLDFFALFSSVTAGWGNPGQADYAAANAFMDAYASERHELTQINQRHGKTLSINWPLWKEGGMRVDIQTEQMMKQNMGMTPMNTKNGIQAFYQAISTGKPQIMAVEGELSRIRQALVLHTEAEASSEEATVTTASTSGSDTQALLAKVQAILVQALSEQMKVPSEDIDIEEELESYGLDQIMLTEWLSTLNQQYGLELKVEVFREYVTLRHFAAYLVEEYRDAIAVHGQAEGVTTAPEYSFEEYQTEEREPFVDTPMTVAHTEGSVLAATSDQLRPKATHYLKQLLSSVIQLPEHRIDAEAPMEKYGIDSFMVIQLTNQLEKSFGPLSKTLFFEYQTISELTGYFLEAHREQLLQLLDVDTSAGTSATEKQSEKPSSLEKNPSQGVPSIQSPIKAANEPRLQTAQTVSTAQTTPHTSADSDIAIIGLSGRYPGARNVREFWKNLQAGKDSITEIPQDRWDLSLYYDEQKGKPGKSYGKWGGFIEGVDQFDPLFFNISPREAELMDPQERLFLQCVYEAMEDAGYSREALRSYRGAGMDGNVGVYVGVMYEEYQLFGAQAQLLGNPIALNGNPSSIANRVSYFCNFHGPSVAVDTMCSSSLTAIHFACQSLRNQECEVAIAGGVNVSIHPNKYLMLAQGRFMSSKGRCESFGQGGDGYVPGEGVGAVLLKPLSKAIADGDQIYGVIKGTAVNHGGKTNGYTVPNPNAQASVIGRAYQAAGIDPRTVSYIEAHGTGTSLGDPIEIAGLTKAFTPYSKEKQFCAIGSVKSNIGHSESAAGMAGLTKVLLQMKHQQIAPSLHSKELNPNIDFSQTPFVVTQELTEWRRPVVEINGKTQEVPRRAGLSSFGAGGSNAHIVLEEYFHTDVKSVSCTTTPHSPAVIILSAKNEERLKEQAQRLLTLIEEDQLQDHDLPDIAYTLQIGREQMEERLGMIVNSISELTHNLREYLADRNGSTMLYRGQFQPADDTISALASDEEMHELIEMWIERKKYAKLLDMWVKGISINWSKLYGEAKPRRISLPAYPFAKERYWVPVPDAALLVNNKGMVPASSTVSPGSVKQGESTTETERALHLLKKEWEPSPATPSRQVKRTIAVLTTDMTKGIAQHLALMLPQVHVLDSQALVAFGGQQGQGYDWSSYDGFVDLTGCGTDGNEQTSWIPWLAQLIENRHKEGVIVLGVTKGLESYQNTTVNLSGASRAGLYRLLQNEYGHLRSRHLDADPYTDDKVLAGQIVTELVTDSEDSEVCYRGGQRYRSYLSEQSEQQPSERGRVFTPFPPDQVLWITGGTRGLGFLSAQHFVAHYGVKRLVLTGRETLPPREQWAAYQEQDTSVAQKIRSIQALEAQGVQVRVLSLRLTDQQDVQKAVDEIKRTMGSIGGVIHCAGMADMETPAFIRKTPESIQQVLAPKVTGLNALYQSMKHEPLQFFVLFSSVSAAIPTLGAGQSDYAMANTYMDYFAGAHQHACPIISIQWPNWKETGMGEVYSRSYEQTGLLSMTNEEGLHLFDRILAHRTGPVVFPAVVNPERWKPENLMRHRAKETPTANVQSGQSGQSGQAIAVTPTQKTTDELLQATQDWLASLLSKELKVDAARLKPDVPFQDYGMDSVLLAQVITNIDRELKVVALDPGAMLEYPTLRSLSAYMTEKYAEVLATLFAIQSTSREGADAEVVRKPLVEPVPFVAEPSAIQQTVLTNPSIKETPARKDKIAIVGLACHFPDATDTSEYWHNLTTGHDSIREVPKSRWDWEKLYDAQGSGEGKSISKWGSFLKGIEDFDPSYFKIGESVAPLIDPLQRQWLEVSAEALADAGYAKQDLWNRQVGVFVGTRAANFIQKTGKSQKDTIVGIGQNFIATHLAHVYNFKGPNMVVDTACSSALTAIHLAVKSIQNGESEVALAGGVEILLDETPYTVLSAAKVLSPDGRCKTFDASANGIGLGEGCGVLVLKPLQQAIRDNNKIYGVIDGSAINNDGNTMGVTTPNPEAQRELIEKAIADANISADTITYVETHGTGTLIGDPIELKALTQIFTKTTSRKQFCGVGSVKSNIGHLLSAAGAASIVKVLLAIAHQELPPTLHCSNPNPRFQFEESPLYIVNQTKRWTTENQILRAGISAFGLGGNNAHIIVSNEGIPDTHKASLAPKGEKVVFNRRRYWPEEFKQDTSTQETQDIQAPSTQVASGNVGQAGTMAFFEPVKVEERK